MEALDEGYRECKDCRQVKPLQAFHWKVRAKGYKQSRCKACACKRSRAWYWLNPEYHRDVRKADRRGEPFQTRRRRWSLDR